MTRTEMAQMCADAHVPDLLEDLHSARREHGHNSEQYEKAFIALWESRISEMSDWQIKDTMETAKPHTQIKSGLATMAWLYDRLMMVCIERGI